MTLGDVLTIVGAGDVPAADLAGHPAAAAVSAIAYDSRRVTPGAVDGAPRSGSSSRRASPV